MLFTFWGNNLTIKNGNITGPVSRAEFVTDPINATLALGSVSGSVHAVLSELIQRGTIDLTLSGDVSTDTQNQFRDILSRNGLQLDTAAFTLDVHKVNVTTGPANVTFAIPASWVDAHGGKDAVRIIRISEETGEQELIDTVYVGVDTQGNMIFRGDSPNGTSLFGLVTAGTTAAAQEGAPEWRYVWPEPHRHPHALPGGAHWCNCTSRGDRVLRMAVSTKENLMPLSFETSHVQARFHRGVTGNVPPSNFYQ